MKREEEIEKSVYDYSKKIEERMNGFDYFNYEHIEHAFIDGIEWADANPKNPWISVEDDLPCNHKELMENEHKTKKVLAVMRSDKSSSKNIEICYMTNQYCSIGNWYWINTLKTHVTHWMPLPELPKK